MIVKVERCYGNPLKFKVVDINLSEEYRDKHFIMNEELDTMYIDMNQFGDHNEELNNGIETFIIDQRDKDIDGLMSKIK